MDETGSWFKLQPRLAGLVRFLVSPPEMESGANDFTPVRTRVEILAYLESTGGGKHYDQQYVNKIVKKLKDALHAYDKRDLLISNKEGVRILIRRRGVHFVRLEKIPEWKREGNASAGGAVPPQRPATRPM